MAPPKTRKDYVSFDAYVDSILLKHDMQKGMFAMNSPASGDVEQLILLLRKYRTKLKEEEAPQRLLDKVKKYSQTVYAAEVSNTHEGMAKVLDALSDFNDFLQSDAGNEVNHYSRILNFAKRNGFDVDRIQRGLRIFSEGLELGLELDPVQVRSGPGYGQFVIGPFMPEEYPYVTDKEEKQPVQKTEQKRKNIPQAPKKEQKQLFEIDTSRKPEPKNSLIGMDEKLPVGDKPLPVRAKLLRDEDEILPDDSVLPREHVLLQKGYYPAKEWIRRFQNTKDIYSRAQNRPGELVAKPDWLLRIMAVRSLVNAKPGDQESLKQVLRMEDIHRRAEELRALPEVKDFLQAMQERPDRYQATISFARQGYGSALDKWFRDYITTNGLIPREPLLQRYLPTAEYRVHIMQERLLYRAVRPDIRQECLIQIIGSRMAVGAKRGGFTGMDSAMKRVPDSETLLKCCELAKEGLKRVPPQKIDKLLEEATEGHGGKMMENFSKITQITTQNWREKLNSQQPIAEERDSLRSL